MCVIMINSACPYSKDLEDGTPKTHLNKGQCLRRPGIIIQTIQRKNINGVVMMSILGILSDYPLFLVVPRHAPEFHGSVRIILTKLRGDPATYR